MNKYDCSCQGFFRVFFQVHAAAKFCCCFGLDLHWTWNTMKNAKETSRNEQQLLQVVMYGIVWAGCLGDQVRTV